tara:strand:- start:318 stop:548 length:231 start_codon:yes stop_codon:yes gene_type:complete
MLKKGDLVSYGAYQAICLGGERLHEKFDDEGMGGLYVPQIRIAILRDSPSQAHRFSYVGSHMWVDRKRVQRITYES